MQKTLKKVLEELNKESPRLDYIRGMLEVLVDEEAIKGDIITHPTLHEVTKEVIRESGDAGKYTVNGESALDVPPISKSYIEKIQKLSNESQE